MKQLHVLLSWESEKDIYELEAEDFEIISKHAASNGNASLFRVDTTDEYHLLLKLKYGNNSVWER